MSDKGNSEGHLLDRMADIIPAFIRWEQVKHVKRPAPEVLGADGLPIKVGETVYLSDFDYEPYNVEILPDHDGDMVRVYGLESKREKLYAYYPDQLTHVKQFRKGRNENHYA